MDFLYLTPRKMISLAGLCYGITLAGFVNYIAVPVMMYFVPRSVKIMVMVAANLAKRHFHVFTGHYGTISRARIYDRDTPVLDITRQIDYCTTEDIFKVPFWFFPGPRSSDNTIELEGRDEYGREWKCRYPLNAELKYPIPKNWHQKFTSPRIWLADAYCADTDYFYCAKDIVRKWSYERGEEGVRENADYIKRDIEEEVGTITSLKLVLTDFTDFTLTFKPLE